MDNLDHALKRSRTGKRHYAAVLIIVLLFGGLFYTGYKPWEQRQHRLAAASVEKHEPMVSTARVSRAAAATDVVLPGTLSAVTESSIYARAEGYIKSRNADIGDRVKAGQLLVEIDTPELDEQLRQSRYRYNQFLAASGATRAAVVLAKANLSLAEVTLKRTEKLVSEGILSKQELDDKKALYDVRAAEVASAEANLKAAEEGKRAVNSDVERLLASTAFQKVTAPFDGIITARNCEVGNLINAAALAGGRELFRLADPRRLKVMVSVPQPDSPSIHMGLAAALSVAEFPGQLFAGKVARTAQSLDPATRTLLTEIHIDNHAGTLMPGMYGEARMTVNRANAPLLIPGDTPVVRADGTYVAVVASSGVVHFQKLTVGRDLGNQVEVLAGLHGDERLVVNPSDDIREGAQVRLAEEKPRLSSR